jgi:hypothetical protein
MMTARAIASALHVLADEYILGDRLPGSMIWYFPEDDLIHRAAPVVPRAMHDALCGDAPATILHDERAEVVICDRCKLSVEHGAG